MRCSLGGLVRQKRRHEHYPLIPRYTVMQAMLLSCIALLSCMRVGALVLTAAPHRRHRPTGLRMSADQPVLMRIVFAATTTASEVRQAITDYPVCDLPGAPTATTADDGAQLML